MVGALLGHAYYTHMSSPAEYKPWPQVQAIITLFENWSSRWESWTDSNERVQARIGHR